MMKCFQLLQGLCKLMVRHSIVRTLPSEVSKSLPSFMICFTLTLGKFTNSFPNGCGFFYRIVFPKKFLLHLSSSGEFFP